MSVGHPYSKNIQESFKVLAPLRIWRSQNEKFYICTENPVLDLIEKASGFDLNKYKEIIKDNNNGTLPDGYYYVNHENQQGGYLYTDSYEEMILRLKSKGLIA